MTVLAFPRLTYVLSVRAVGLSRQWTLAVSCMWGRIVQARVRDLPATTKVASCPRLPTPMLFWGLSIQTIFWAAKCSCGRTWPSRLCQRLQANLGFPMKKPPMPSTRPRTTTWWLLLKKLPCARELTRVTVSSFAVAAQQLSISRKWPIFSVSNAI